MRSALRHSARLVLMLSAGMAVAQAPAPKRVLLITHNTFCDPTYRQFVTGAIRWVLRLEK
jgi:hypothetical protein